MTAGTVLDIALVAALVVLALRAVHAAELFTAIVFYIAFGLLLAVVWVRLEAPDLALAEAGIGAGVTGAMLLEAAAQLGPAPRRLARLGPIALGMAWATVAGVALLLIAVAAYLADRSESLAPLAFQHLPESGVENPITAVLLNFRGYDTWLEIGVLLGAAVAVLAIRRFASPGLPAPISLPDRAALGALTIVVPAGVLLAGYLLWRGTHAPGGGFQAGAILGAVGVLSILANSQTLADLPERWLRLILAAAFFAFLLLAVLGLARGGSILEYPPGSAGVLILALEAAVAVSIGLTLVVLFAGGGSSGIGRDIRSS